MVDDLLSIPLMGQVSRSDAGQRSARDDDAGLCEFLVGPENHLAAVAVRAVLEQTNRQYNPILFHGPHGSGKSHLAWSLAAAWRTRFPRRSGVYTTAWEFSQELADAIDAQNTEDLRAVYRRLSLLVMEDLERFADKPFAQQELVDTMDELVRAGSRIVLTASTAPSGLSGISPQLQSRLVAGLTVPLTLPAPNTRFAILQRLASLRGIDLPEAAARALAEGLCGGVPDLCGALLHLEMSAQADRLPITAERARRYLAERNGSREPSLRTIASTTARQFSLRLTELQSPSRSRAIVTARNVAMYLARTLTRHSLEQIGRYFGGRDHTTVSHGCRKTEEILESEPGMRQTVVRLQKRVLHQA